MIVFVVVVSAYALMFWALATLQWPMALLLLAAYILGGECAVYFGSGQSQWLRRNFAPAWLRAAFGGIDRESMETLERLAADDNGDTTDAGYKRRQYVFGVDPHGRAADGLVAGFACHGCSGRVGALLDETRVIAHGVHRGIPFVREFYQLFGVVPHWRGAVESALNRGEHIALSPSGVDGCMQCIDEPSVRSQPLEGSGQATIVVYRRASGRVGFLSLAARRNAYVVPVLVVGTSRSWTMWRPIGQSLWPLLAEVHCKTRSPVQCVVGRPISTDHCAHDSPSDMRALTEQYYDALIELGAERNISVLVCNYGDRARAPRRQRKESVKTE